MLCRYYYFIKESWMFFGKQKSLTDCLYWLIFNLSTYSDLSIPLCCLLLKLISWIYSSVWFAALGFLLLIDFWIPPYIKLSWACYNLCNDPHCLLDGPRTGVLCYWLRLCRGLYSGIPKYKHTTSLSLDAFALRAHLLGMVRHMVSKADG